MMTSFEQEWAELRRWQPRGHARLYRYLEGFVRNEFADPDAHQRWLTRILKCVLAFAYSETPFYVDRDRKLDFSPTDLRNPDELVAIPVLSRRDVADHAQRMQPRRLPTGVEVVGTTKSAGTTGPPVVVRSTRFNFEMFILLWHRQARWFRFDPTATLCDIRIGREIGNGTSNPDGKVVRYARWRNLGQLFETGPEIGFNVSNDMAQQIGWLQEFRPDYVMSDPGLFEELALANGGTSPTDSIKALLAVTSQLSDSMRRQLDRFYDVPIHQTYGLNEIGKVAFRCDEARYHTNIEHCHVEIVDDDGQHCQAGETGRIVVTALLNPAMPLIRYDTGDLATAVEGPCRCGRTLPSFGEIQGRYRRYANLPPKTRERFTVIRYAFGDFPVEKLGFVRQFQVHLHRDNRFEMRLCTTRPIPIVFHEHMQTKWREAAIEPAMPLDIRRVDAISRSPSGKFLDFTSDFHEDELGRESVG